MIWSQGFRFILIGLGMLISSISIGQSYYFGPKFGTALAFQQWSTFDPNPKLAFHGSIFIESAPEDKKGSVYAQLGYLQRGSSIRQFSFNGNFFGNSGFVFNNIGLELGIKRVISLEKKIQPFYSVGARLEYTVSNNLKQYERFGSPVYPHDDFVKNVVYGITIGGGFQYQLSEFYGGSIEFALCPDLADQYYQPEIKNVINPYPTGERTITLKERQIRNVTFEIRLAMKFLRKVEYY